MLRTFYHGVDDSLAAEVLGPGGVPALRRLLLDPGFPRRDNVVAFLAHLDRGDATHDLLRFLAAPPAPVERAEEDRALLLAPHALGRIARRGDPAALAALLQMTDPSGDGGLLDGAASRSSRPERLRADLREMALWGLAASGAPEARDRIAAWAADGESPEMARAAADALKRFDGDEGASAEEGASASPDDGERPEPPTEPWGQPAGLRAISSGVFGEERRTDGQGPGGSGGGAVETLDTSAWVHNGALDYANHPAVVDPMTNAVLDANLAAVSLRAGRSDFSGDVACCTTLSRLGNARTFGSVNDGLDTLNTAGEMNSVLDNNTARVKVIRLIQYCGGPTSNSIGCGWVGFWGLAVVRVTPPDDDEGVLWMHEYGHNVGGAHNADNRYIMHGTNLGTNNGINATECGKYHNPPAQAQAVLTNTGVCVDADGDEVHDGIDNCDTGVNPAQADVDGDGFGVPCDTDDLDPLVCGLDDDADGCDDCAGGAGPNPATDGPDADGDGLCDAADADADNDGYSNADETTNCLPAANPLDAQSRPLDTDLDGICNTLDPDDDGDGYSDVHETLSCVPASDPLDPGSRPVDTDLDGICDTLDDDADADGDPDETDCAPADPDIHHGATEIGCNGVDEDCDGLADDTTVDADGDQVTCDADADDADPAVCGPDVDADGCDDCGAGLGAGPDPADDGLDTDGDGACNAGDPDDDDDGYTDEDETVGCVPPSDPLDPLSTPIDTDNDGICDTLDVDSDGDGDNDFTDCAPLDPLIFTGATEIGCNGIDENCSGPEDDATVDVDGDTIGCGTDPDDGDPLVCGQDADGDACDDCAAGLGPDPATDGADLDGDGLCDAGDPDEDGDGYTDDDETTGCAPPSDPRDAGSVPVDTDADLLCDTLDPDDDGDGYPDDDETTGCAPSSDPLDAGSVPVDRDGDFICDTLDDDDDGDGDPDITDCAPLDPAISADAAEIGCNGIDENCSGPEDDTAVDGDGDTVACGADPDDGDATACGLDADADSCDDCTGGLGPDPATDGADLDADGLCDDGDPDEDGDGYSDLDETTACAPASDPRDALSVPADRDGDLVCDTLDPDDDGDGDTDATDCAPLDPAIFSGAIEIGCNSIDENCNGAADDATVDADGDTVDCSSDPDDGDATVCGLDAEGDTCDDCAAGAGPDPATDGADLDADGLCDAGDPDDDADGDPDVTDCALLDPAIHAGAAEIACNNIDENCNGPADDATVDADGDTVGCGIDPDDEDPTVCGLDADADTCDDCTAGAGPDPATDGADLDGDGLCDAGDPDVDGDGDADVTDCAPLDPAIHAGAPEIGCNGIDENCSGPADDGLVDGDGDTVGCGADPDDGDATLCGLDADVDSCDDCTAGLGPDPATDGTDTDADGLCNAGDLDDDGDGYSDVDETTACAPPSDPLDGGSIPVDTDADLLCDTLDPDDDGDGNPDGTDCAPLDPLAAGPDTDGDGLCDAVDPDDDGDGVDDGVDNCPLTPNPGQEDADLDGVGDICQASIPGLRLLPGTQAGGLTGLSVAADGDANGDGLDDILVGSPGFTGGASAEGRVQLYLGSNLGPLLSPSWEARGGQASAQLGTSVAWAGDVNGDGYDEVIAGAPGFDGGHAFEGIAYLYLGSATGPSAMPAWSVEGGQTFADLGISVAGVGDVNGDGFDDVLVGADQFANGQSGEGRALLFLGSAAGLSTTPAWTAEGNEPFVSFGFRVAGAGDVNDDGFDDILVGAPVGDEARLYLGSASGPAVTASWTATVGEAGALFGGAVAGAGDVNGDGFADIAVGAFFRDGAQADAGAAYVYAGSPTGPAVTPSWTAAGNQMAGAFGIALVGGNDVNGDGFADLLVGASLQDQPEAEEGRAYLFLGSAAGLATTAGWIAEPDVAGAYFAESLAAGQVNGNGYADLVVGAWGFTDAAGEVGAVFVYIDPALVGDPDGDGFEGTADCNAFEDKAWAVPSAVGPLTLSHDLGSGVTTLTWSMPLEPGGVSLRYDLLRTDSAAGFGAAACVEADDVDTQAGDATPPATGAVLYYLPRAENDCPQMGTLGTTSGGTPRAGPACS